MTSSSSNTGTKMLEHMPHTKRVWDRVLNPKQATESSVEDATFMELSSDETFYSVAEEIVLMVQSLKAGGGEMKKVNDFFPLDATVHGIESLSVCRMERVPLPELDDPSQPFRYDPLTGPDMIRVLLLHKGRDSDPLEGSLRHECLGGKTRYDTLSYAWGNDSMSCSMRLNGKRMPLTRSLYDALRCLRRHDTDRAVWADGVCINQADNAEKSAQVALIPRIYDQAQVFAYLGPEADDSGLLPALFNQLSRIEYEDFLEYSSTSGNLSPRDDPKWHALLTFMARPWFTRLWVVQEVVVAREVCFLCGDWAMGWRPLYYVAELISNFRDFFASMCYEAAASLEAAWCLQMMFSTRLGRCSTYGKLHEIKARVEGWELKPDCREPHRLGPDCAKKRDLVVKSCIEDSKMYQWVERGVAAVPSVSKPSEASLLFILTMFRFNETTYPQDRLYALAGLAGDVTLKDFPPDYGETVKDANARLSKVMVEKGLGMAVLYHATKWSTDPPLTPSWAVRWTNPRLLASDWQHHYWFVTDGESDERTPSSLMSLVDNHVLKVSGHELDGCQAPVVVFPDTDSKPENLYSDELVTFLRQSSAVFSGNDYFTGEPWSEVWGRTLHFTIDQYSREQSFVNFKEEYSETRECDSSGELQLLFNEGRFKNSAEWVGAVKSRMNGQAVCSTSKGYACVVPNSTLATDKIFVFEASEMPFVLRPVPGQPRHYTFVGGCYVHGLMAGEASKLDHTNLDIFIV